MERYLIVTADDLGIAESVNEGIAKSYREGIVKSISAIPTGEAFKDAVRLIGELGFPEIGAHLALTETKPLLSTSKFYRNHNLFFLDLFLGNIRPDYIYAELKAQLELLKDTGLKIAHINSHEHIHMMPRILDIFIALAKEYGIPAIRYPRGDRPAHRFSLSENYRSAVLSYLSHRTERVFISSGLRCTDSFFGLLDAGKLDENKILKMLDSVPAGVTELVTHPGFLSPQVLDSYSWHIGAETELFALTGNKIKNAIKNKGINLIGYNDFLTLKK